MPLPHNIETVLDFSFLFHLFLLVFLFVYLFLSFLQLRFANIYHYILCLHKHHSASSCSALHFTNHQSSHNYQSIAAFFLWLAKYSRRWKCGEEVKRKLQKLFIILSFSIITFVLLWHLCFFFVEWRRVGHDKTIIISFLCLKKKEEIKAR